MTFSKMLRIVRQLQGPINQMFVFISFIVENEVFGCLQRYLELYQQILLKLSG